MSASTKNNITSSASLVEAQNKADKSSPFETALMRLEAALSIVLRPLSTARYENSNMLRAQWQRAGENRYLLLKQYVLPQDIALAHEVDLRQVMVTRIQKDYATMEMLHAYWENSAKFEIPRPIACYPDLLILAMDECLGQDLTILIRQKARFYPDTRTMEHLKDLCYLCGEWVKAHQQGNFGKEQPATFYLEAFLEYIDIRLCNLVKSSHVSLDESLHQEILRYARRRWRDLKAVETRTVDIHGDYAPSNVMTNGEKLVVIDFTTYGHGSIYHDLSRFYHQLEMYLSKPIFRPKVIRCLQRALLNGYDASLTPQNPLFELMLVQHTLCHLIGIARLEQVPFHRRWYNRRVIRRHIRWLRETCLKLEICK